MPKLTFLGHSAFLVEGSGGRLIIDPFLTGNPLATARPDDIEVDYIILTHGHGDHLGDTMEIAKRNEATVVAPNELANYCGSQGAKFHPMSIGGIMDLPFWYCKVYDCSPFFLHSRRNLCRPACRCPNHDGSTGFASRRRYRPVPGHEIDWRNESN